MSYSAADAYAEELGEYDDDQLWELFDNTREKKKLDLIVRELEFRGHEVPHHRKGTVNLPCRHCGTLNTEEVRAQLWSLYDRLDDGGRKHIEPLVYTQSDFEDMGYHSMYDMDDESIDSVKLSMENNMAERGLCPSCGLPDLRGYTEKDFLSEEDARDLADMYAEMAAERRAGC